MHYRGPFLGDRDSFGDLCRGCQTLGMVVLSRVVPHAAYEDTRRTHPEWLLVDEQAE